MSHRTDERSFSIDTTRSLATQETGVDWSKASELRLTHYGPLLLHKTDKDPEGVLYRSQTWLDVKPSNRSVRQINAGVSAVAVEHRPDGLPRIERLTSAEAASRGGFKDKTTSVVVGDPARFRHFDFYWEAGTAPRLVSVCSEGSDSASAPVSDHDGSVQPGHDGSAESTGQMSASETAFGVAGSDSTEIWNVEAVLTDEGGSREYERVVWHLV